MLHKKHNALVTLTLLLALVGVTKPAKALAEPRSQNADVEITEPNSSKGNLVADANLNEQLEDSGAPNTDLEDSGAPNTDLEDSGNLNLDFEGGGEINSDFTDSGSPNTDFEDSGEVNPDHAGSGEPLSLNNGRLELNSKVVAHNTATEGNEETVASNSLENNGEAIAQNNTVEETPDAGVTEKKSSWWWWLIPLIGIPLLAATILLGGRKRSDREPAIDNIPPNNDAPDGVIGFTAPSDGDGGNLSAIGTNNAADNVNASTVGGAIAGGTAPLSGGTAALNDRQEEDIQTESTDIVAEIPSDSVSEFTGQETKLQVSNQPTIPQTNSKEDLDDSEFTGQETKLQFSNQPTILQTNDEENSDAEEPEFFDRVAQSGASVAGTIGLGSIAVSNPDRDDTVTDEEAISKEPDIDIYISEQPTDFTATVENSYASEQPTDFPATVDNDADRDLVLDEANEINEIAETNVGREFRGDYVLQEETATLSDNSASDIDLRSEETTNDIWAMPDDVAGDASNPEIVVDEDTTVEENSSTVGRDLAEDVATERDFTEESEPSEAEFTLNTDPENVIDLRQDDSSISETTDVSPTDIDTAAVVDSTTHSPDMDFSDRRDTVTDVDTNVDIDVDTDTSDRPNLAGGAATAGGAVLGGMAAAEFWERDTSDNEPLDTDFTVEESPITDSELERDLNLDTNDEWQNNTETVADESTIDTELNAIGEEDTANNVTYEVVENELNAVQPKFQETEDLDAVAETNSENFAADVVADSQDYSLENRTLDDSDNASDASSEDLVDESTATDFTLEEITFDEPPASEDPSLEELAFENDSDDVLEASLEQMTFDQSAHDNARLEEITFDQPATSGETNLEEITFDEPAASEDTTLEDLTFENDSDDTIEASLEQMTFDEPVNNNARFEDLSFDQPATNDETNSEEITFDEPVNNNVRLEDLSFEEPAASGETNLEEITFDEPAASEDTTLEDLTFENDSDDTIEASLEEMAFDEPANNNARFEDLSFEWSTDDETSLEELTFENDSDDALEASSKQMTFDHSPHDNVRFEDLSFEPSVDDDRSLEEITFNEPATDDTSLEDLSFEQSDNFDDSFVSDTESSGSDINVDLDSLVFEEIEAKDNSTFDLLENNTADIADISDEKSDDMSNISEWLDSLETPRKDTDDISEWLNSLDTGDLDSVREDRNSDKVMDLEGEADDISFQFLEDLLERDSNNDEDPQ